MAKPTDIPNEIVISIFQANDSIRAAAKLGQTNKRLNVIWIDLHKNLALDFYQRTVSNVSAARDLALVEAKLARQRNYEEVTANDIQEINLPLSVYVPIMLRHVRLANLLSTIGVRSTRGPAYIKAHDILYYTVMKLTWYAKFAQLLPCVRRAIYNLPVDDLEELRWKLKDVNWVVFGPISSFPTDAPRFELRVNQQLVRTLRGQPLRSWTVDFMTQGLRRVYLRRVRTTSIGEWPRFMEKYGSDKDFWAGKLKWKGIC